MIVHPFIGDLSEKSMEDLGNTINSLNKNLQFAFRRGNQQMVNQINMALNSYRGEYNRRQQEIWDKKSKDFEKKIDIT